MSTNDQDFTACRAAFVKIVKEENGMRDGWGRVSLRAHHFGPQGGFGDRHVQDRWLEFRAGWVACLKYKGGAL
jgi:hypothetical protein